jgi:cobalt-precorrin 5A hydrolase
MTGTCVIALPRFAGKAGEIARHLGADLIPYGPDAFASAFSSYRGIVAVMSAGIVVRSIAPLLKDKWSDPAVVVVSPDLTWAVPVAGGHHGANRIARSLAELGIRPVITTATETLGRMSVEAFASTLRVHRKAFDAQLARVLTEPDTTPEAPPRLLPSTLSLTDSFQREVPNLLLNL